MDTESTTTNGASSAPIILDDGPGADLIGDAPPAAAAAAKPDTEKPPEKPQDADELMLELGRRTREAQQTTKTNAAKQKELDGLIGKHKQFADVLALAKSDPMAFIEKLADAAGLDVDTAVEAYTTRKAGGKRDLTPDERIARMEAERARETQEREEREAKDKADREKTEGDAAVQRQVDGLKSLAK